jgi:hypothetical protein
MVRGAVKDSNGKLVKRGKLSGTYPLLLGLEWGRAIAGAVLRLASASAQQWAERSAENCRSRSRSRRAPPEVNSDERDSYL